MNRFALSVFFVTAGLAGSFQNAHGQAINATVQTAAPRATASRGAPATAARPVAPARVAPQLVPRPTGLAPQSFNSNLPRMIAQPQAYLQRTYSPAIRSVNPGPAALNTQRGGPVQQPISLDPATRQTEVRTLAAMHQRRGFVTREGNIMDPATRQNEIHALTAVREHRGVAPAQSNIPDAATRDAELRTLETMRERRTLGGNNQTLATIDPQRNLKNRDSEAGPPQEKPDGPKDGHGKKWHNKKDQVSFDDAFRRHWHESHDRNWWHDHCQTIVFVVPFLAVAVLRSVGLLLRRSSF